MRRAVARQKCLVGTVAKETGWGRRRGWERWAGVAVWRPILHSDATWCHLAACDSREESPEPWHRHARGCVTRCSAAPVPRNRGRALDSSCCSLRKVQLVII